VDNTPVHSLVSVLQAISQARGHDQLSGKTRIDQPVPREQLEALGVGVRHFCADVGNDMRRNVESTLHCLAQIVAENVAQVFVVRQGFRGGGKLGGKAAGVNSKISWTQVETGSAITWKYPSVILQGDNSTGEFYSVALVNNYQQADTGTKMIHIGSNTRSTIVAKGISAGHGQNTYRGLVKIMPSAAGARNFTRCDSLLIGEECGAHTVPYIEVRNPTARMEHEASTSKVSEDQLFYLMQRGISEENAQHMIINGFCRGVFQELPFEFAMEASQLLKVSLEGAIG